MEEIQKQIKNLQEKLKELVKPEKKIKNLVFSGGSSKGFSYLGVIKAFEEYGILDNLEEITGTSIGSLFGFFIVLKFRSSDLINIFIEMDLNWLHNINSDSVLNLINKYGLDNGSNMEKFISHFLEVRFPTKNPANITFLDIWNYNPIKLTMTGTRILQNIIEPELFNHILTPNMPIVKALRITMAIPPLFTPIETDYYHLADGGIVNNYPIDLYDIDDKMDYTLGVLSAEKTNKEKCKNVSDIYKSIVGYLIAKDTLKKQEKYSENTIVVEIELSLYQIFNLGIEDKINIINLGYHLTKQYLNIKNYKEKDKTTETDKDLDKDKDIIDTKEFNRKLENSLAKKMMKK
jgi:predicted acylesterase/phospholipase RssA